MSDVKVYGAVWCEETEATRQELDQLGIPYEYHDIDIDPDAKEWVLQHNHGKQRTPTLDIDGDILSEPDTSQLLEALRGRGLAS